MNKDLTKNYMKEILYKYSVLTALAASFFACSGINPIAVIIAVTFASAIFIYRPETNLLPVYLSFLISLYLSKTAGTVMTIIAFIIAGIIIVFSDKISLLKTAVRSNEFKLSVMLAAALTMTILITTDYFGIGADGNTVIEMFRSYRSLGFHPNWRGILYGTIVMVVMITFPREFRKATRYLSASFMALIIIYIFNAFLIPKGSVSPIALLENPEFNIFSSSIFSGNADLKASSICRMLISAVALAISFIMADNDGLKNKKENLCTGLSTVVISSVFGYMIPGKPAKKPYEFICGIISSLLILITMLSTGAFSRMPVAGCAVVLIVGAWQALDFGLFRKVFSSFRNVVVFIIIIAITMLTNISIGMTAATIFCMITEKINSGKTAKE